MKDNEEVKKGRPSIYTKELADTILNRIKEGESVRSICRDNNMPVQSTIYAWCNNNDAFSKQYEIARQEQAHNMFEELLEIADDGKNDYMLKQVGDNEIEVLNSENIQRSRLRVDTRKWFLSKVVPKLYGDKLDLTSKGDKLEAVPILGGITNNVQSNNNNKEDTEAEEEN